MNWINSFKILNTAIIILFLIKIYLPIGRGDMVDVFTFISIIFYFAYIHTLNNAIKINKNNKTLKYLEYILYLFIAIDIISFVMNVSYIVINTGLFNINLWLLQVIIKIIILVYIIHSFSIRKKRLGKFNTKEECVNSLDSLKQKSFETIKQRLDLCKLCTKRTYNSNIGLICSLTQVKPDFRKMCAEFNLDIKEYQKRKNRIINKSKKKPIWAYIITGLIIIRILIKLIQLINK